MTFAKLLIAFSKKGNLIYLLYLIAWRYCLLHLIKQNYYKHFSKNSNLYESGNSLPTFLSMAHLKLHHIHVTPNLVKDVIKNVITNLDLYKVSGLNLLLSWF